MVVNMMGDDGLAAVVAQRINAHRMETTNLFTRQVNKLDKDLEKDIRDIYAEDIKQLNDQYSAEALQQTKRLEETRSLLSTQSVQLEQQAVRIRELERNLESSIQHRLAIPALVKTQEKIGYGTAKKDKEPQTDPFIAHVEVSLPNSATASSRESVSLSDLENLKLQYENLAQKYNNVKEAKRLNEKQQRERLEKCKASNEKYKATALDFQQEKDDVKKKSEFTEKDNEILRRRIHVANVALQALNKRYRKSSNTWKEWIIRYSHESEEANSKTKDGDDQQGITFQPPPILPDLSAVFNDVSTKLMAPSDQDTGRGSQYKTKNSECIIKAPTSQVITPKRRRRISAEFDRFIEPSARKGSSHSHDSHYDSDQTSDGDYIHVMTKFSPTSRAIARGPGPETMVALFEGLPSIRATESDISQFPGGTMEAPVHIKSEADSSGTEQFKKRGYHEFSNEEDDLDLDAIVPIDIELSESQSRMKKKSRMSSGQIDCIVQRAGRADLMRELSALAEVDEDKECNDEDFYLHDEIADGPHQFFNNPTLYYEQEMVKRKPTNHMAGKRRHQVFQVSRDTKENELVESSSAEELLGREATTSEPSRGIALTTPKHILAEIPNPNHKTDMEHTIPLAVAKVRALHKSDRKSSTPVTRLVQGLPTPSTSGRVNTRSPISSHGSSTKRKKRNMSMGKPAASMYQGHKVFAEDGMYGGRPGVDVKSAEKSKPPQYSQELPPTPDTFIKRPKLSSGTPVEKDIFEAKTILTPPALKRHLIDLDVTDFRINPEKNGGVPYAFTEVIRDKASKACLPSCVKVCCLDLVDGKLEKLWGGLPPQLEGPRFRSSSEAEMSSSQEEAVDNEHEIWKAKRKVAQKALEFGKHKAAFERRTTPPHFFDSDMPSTQQQQARNEESDLQRREKAWAMKEDPRYLLKDGK